MDRINRDALDCWPRARSATIDAAVCQGLDEQAVKLQAALVASDRRVEVLGASCEIAKVNADGLQAKREDQAAVADAAFTGMQGAGQARQEAAATQAAAPRPVHCSSTQAGAQTYTTCQ